MDIKIIAYEKYKRDWLTNHPVSEMCINDIADEWMLSRMKDGTPITFTQYIEEHGFHGDLWVNMDEFLDCQYQDREHIRSLLTSEEYLQYLDDIGDGHLSYIDALHLVKECLDEGVLDSCQDGYSTIAYEDGYISRTIESVARILMTDAEGRNVLNKTLAIHRLIFQQIPPDNWMDIGRMHGYGYTNDGILPIGKGRAKILFVRNYGQIYRLYEDGTESAVESFEEIEKHQGLFGIEKRDWVHGLKRHGYHFFFLDEKDCCCTIDAFYRMLLGKIRRESQKQVPTVANVHFDREKCHVTEAVKREVLHAYREAGYADSCAFDEWRVGGPCVDVKDKKLGLFAWVAPKFASESKLSHWTI